MVHHVISNMAACSLRALGQQVFISGPRPWCALTPRTEAGVARHTARLVKDCTGHRFPLERETEGSTTSLRSRDKQGERKTDRERGREREGERESERGRERE